MLRQTARHRHLDRCGRQRCKNRKSLFKHCISALLTGRQGGLTNVISSPCIVSIQSVTENYETYLCVLARFPSSRSLSEYHFDARPFQYMGFRFYGDAFQSFDRDFLFMRITEAEKLPDILQGDTQAVAAIAEKGDLCKLELTYQPDKVVTMDKDDPEEFSVPESSHAAKLLRYLVEGEKPKTLTLCFRANETRIGKVINLRDRLLHEQNVLPFQEYRDSHGKIVLVIEVLVRSPKLIFLVSNTGRRGLSRKLIVLSCRRRSSLFALWINTLLPLLTAK